MKYNLRHHFDKLASGMRMLNALIGILHLELAKERYERSGLVGKAVSDGGRKHMKTTFGMVMRNWDKSCAYQIRSTAVEINLRQPSMLHGKKGFERIVWAFKNVLNQAVTWLFHNHDATSDGKP